MPSIDLFFPNLEQATIWLRKLHPIAVRYPRIPFRESRFVHLTDDEAGLRAGCYVRLPEAAQEAQSDLNRIVEHFTTGEISSAFPEKAASQSMPQWLETAYRLTPTHRELTRRCDLLVAVYAVGEFREVFEKTPHNPDHPSEIVFLAGDPNCSIPYPAVIYSIPQADPNVPWKMWLDSVSHESASAGKSVRLFARQFNDVNAGHYYVEYGWVHPIEQLAELHQETAVKWVLISRNPTPAVNGDARVLWTRIEHSARHYQMTHKVLAQDVFDFSIPAVADNISVAQISRGRSFPMEARLRRVLADESKPIASLEEQIQLAKQRVFQLERERAVLLQRTRTKFRFLLVFRQPVSDGPISAPLAAGFARFLEYTENRLDRMRYAFQSDPATGQSFHLVLTRDFVFYDEIHLELADEYYYQRDDWTLGGFHLFVDSCHELLPRLTDRGLKAGFWDALKNVIPQTAPSSQETCLLLSPLDGSAGGGRDGAFSVTVAGFSGQGADTLLARREFLNTAFPLRELEECDRLKAEFRKRLHDQSGSLAAHVEQIEQQLAEQTSARMSVVRQSWNELAPRIESQSAVVQGQWQHYDLVQAMITDAAQQWSDFAKRFFQITADLIAAKVQHLDRFANREDAWRTVMANVETSHQDVSLLCEKTDQEFQSLIAKAEQEESAARDKLAQVTADVTELTPEERDRVAQIEEHVSLGAEMLKAIQKSEAHAGEQAAVLNRIAESVRDCQARLQQKWNAFDLSIQQMRTSIDQNRQTIQAIQSQRLEQGELRADWEQALQEGNALRETAFQEYRTTHDRIEAASGELAASTNLTDQQIRTLEQELESLRRKDADLEARIQRLRELNKLAGEIHQRLVENRKVNHELDQRCQNQLQGLRSNRDQRVQQLAKELQQTLNDLKVLSSLETEESSFRLYQQAARRQANLAKKYQKRP